MLQTKFDPHATVCQPLIYGDSFKAHWRIQHQTEGQTSFQCSQKRLSTPPHPSSPDMSVKVSKIRPILSVLLRVHSPSWQPKPIICPLLVLTGLCCPFPDCYVWSVECGKSMWYLRVNYERHCAACLTFIFLVDHLLCGKATVILWRHSSALVRNTVRN